MGHLLKIHLLKKTAWQQNLDCSTHVKQITKIVETAWKLWKYAVRIVLSRCKFETKTARQIGWKIVTARILKIESLEHVRQVRLG